MDIASVAPAAAGSRAQGAPWQMGLAGPWSAAASLRTGPVGPPADGAVRFRS
jgi:hypothetical protein